MSSRVSKGAEAQFRRVVTDHVAAPLLQAGYERHGQAWDQRTNGLHRHVDVQRNSDGGVLRFTINVLLGVEGMPEHSWGVDSTRGEAIWPHAIDRRIGTWIEPYGDLWWAVDEDGVRPAPFFGRPGALSDGREIEATLRAEVLPFLASFTAASDVPARLAGPATLRRLSLVGGPQRRSARRGCSCRALRTRG